jgi:hypothetical protein
MPSKPVTCTDVLDATTDKSLTKQVIVDAKEPKIVLMNNTVNHAYIFFN